MLNKQYIPSKQNIAEWIPFGLFLIVAACYFMRNTQVYANIFAQVDYCLNAAFIFCIFGWLIATTYDWGHLSKGALAGLFVFNSINYMDKFYFHDSLDSTYYTAFMVVWVLIMLLITILEFTCGKYRILK